MRGKSSALGLIGLVLLLFAGVAATLTGGTSVVDKAYIAVNGVLGAFALIAFLSTGLEQIREAVGQRSTKYGANVILGSIVFLAILGVVNFLSARNPKRFDLTEQNVFSLSEQSAQVVAKLTNDLTVKAFVEGGVSPGLRDLLDTYRYHSEKFKFDLIDPDREPQLAEKYAIRAYNSVHFEFGKESVIITAPSEENITNAIIKVTRDSQKTACFIEGHGELSIDDQTARGLSSIKAGFEGENYKVEKVLLASMESVPATCSLIVIAGPERPFQESELTALRQYLSTGGRALILVHARAGDDLKPLLAEYGVNLGDNVIVDQVIRLFQGPSLGLNPLVKQYGRHEITENFAQMTSFSLSRSVHAATDGKAGLEAVEIALTSDSSWAETDVAGLFERSTAVLDETADKKGPVPVAVAVNAAAAPGEGSEPKPAARLVVFGSSDMAQNRDVDGTYYNRDLLLNSAGWLAGQSDLVSIRPRAVRASRMRMSDQQIIATFYLSVLVLPQILLLAGIAVWWRRE